MASASACASTSKENGGVSDNSFETPLVEFMYKTLIRDAVTEAIWHITGGKVKLGHSKDDIIRTFFTMSKSLLETHPFDESLIEALRRSILESKDNLEKGDGPVSFWVLKEFDVIERDGKNVVVLKNENEDPSTPLREVIGCDVTFKLIQEAHLKNNHAGFNELEKILMPKYFFHRTCLVSYLKLCSVCNKDPSKIPIDDLLPKLPVDNTTPMNSVIVKPMDPMNTNNCETPFANVILKPNNSTNASNFEIPIENVMLSSEKKMNTNSCEFSPFENIIHKATYQRKTYKAIPTNETPLLTIANVTSLAEQPNILKESYDTKKVKAGDNFPKWVIPPEVSEQAQIQTNNEKCKKKTSSDNLLPIFTEPVDKLANQQSTTAQTKLTITPTLVIESTPTISISQDPTSSVIQPSLPKKLNSLASHAPTTSVDQTSSSSFVESKNKPQPVQRAPKISPKPTFNIKPASTYATSKITPKTHKPSLYEAAKRKSSKKLEEFKKTLMPPPSKKAKSLQHATSSGSDKKFAVCRAEVMPLKDTTEESEYKALLLYMDTCSKYVLLKPLRSKNIDEVTEQLYRIFADFGPPEVILTHMYQRTLFDVIRKVMKQGPVGATFTVEVSKTMRSIISEQVLLLIEKWSSVTNCKDMFIASLEIQKQLNSFMSTNYRSSTNPFYSIFGSKRAPYKNFNQYFSMAALLDREDKIATEGKSHEDIASSSKTQSLLISSDFTASDSFPKIADIWSVTEKNQDDDDEPIIIEEKVEVINLSDDDIERREPFDQMKIGEGNLLTQFENFFPAPIKTENIFARQAKEEQSTVDRKTLLNITDSKIFKDPKLSVAQPFVVLERCDKIAGIYLSKKLRKKYRLKHSCHECGKPVKMPVFCQDCSRPVHFNDKCSRDRNILEVDERVSCKTCVKIQEKLNTIEFEVILPDEYKNEKY